MPTYGYLMTWSRSRLYINNYYTTCTYYILIIMQKKVDWTYLNRPEYTIIYSTIPCNTFDATHGAPTLATAVAPLVERHDVVERDPPPRSGGSWTIQPPGAWIHCLREPQHTPRAYPRHPQSPKWKEFLHKLLVGGLGYAPGVCWKILRHCQRLGCNHMHILNVSSHGSPALWLWHSVARCC